VTLAHSRNNERRNALPQKDEHCDIIDLAYGEPDFPTPGHIRDAAVRAIRDGRTRLSPHGGLPELREAISHKLARENRIHVAPEQIIVTSGAKQAVFLALQCVLRPGDEVLIPRPSWFAYPYQVKSAGGVPVFVSTRQEERFIPSADQLRAAVTKATRVVLLNTPCNPTGAVYGLELLRVVAQVALEHDLLVLVDEVYEKILFDGAVHVSMASLDERIAARTITINSFSKTYAMAGWRVGYCVLPSRLARTAIEMQSWTTSAPSAVSQWAALEALSGPQAAVQSMVAEYAARRQLLSKRLIECKEFSCMAPQGTFYLYLDVSKLIGRQVAGCLIRNAGDLAETLLHSARVRVISGTMSGSNHHVRLAFTLPLERLGEAADRLQHTLSSAQ